MWVSGWVVSSIHCRLLKLVCWASTSHIDTHTGQDHALHRLLSENFSQNMSAKVRKWKEWEGLAEVSITRVLNVQYVCTVCSWTVAIKNRRTRSRSCKRHSSAEPFVLENERTTFTLCTAGGSFFMICLSFPSDSMSQAAMKSKKRENGSQEMEKPPVRLYVRWCHKISLQLQTHCCLSTRCVCGLKR